MSGWAIAVAAFLTPSLLLGGFTIWAVRSRKVCPCCQYPGRKCECPPPCKHDWWSWRWTEDGWVKVCRVCGDPSYGGDGAEPVERD